MSGFAFKRFSVATLLAASLFFVPAADAEIRVTGEVFDSEGRPVPARIELFERLDRLRQARVEMEGSWFAEAVATARTDDAGRFRIEAPEAGMWLLVVRARGMAPAFRSLEPLVEPRHLGSLRLVPSEPLEVRVLDARGLPVSGAVVRATRESMDRARELLARPWWLLQPIGATDGEGSLRFDAPRGLALELAAWSPGYLEGRGAASWPRTALSLEPAGPALLEVTNRGERSLPGVAVRMGDEGWPVGSTDREGGLELPWKPGEDLPLVLADGTGRSLDTSFPGTTPEGGSYRLSLPEAASWQGRVVSSLDRKPIAKALVWLHHAPQAWTRTDATGTYRLTVGRAAQRPQMRVRAAAPNYISGWSGEQRIQEQAPVLALAPSASLDGFVLDMDERPLAGALVRARQVGHGRYRSGRRLPPPALTDERGFFRLTGLSPGSAYELEASYEDRAPATVTAATAAAGEISEELRIRLSPGSRAFGRVLDAFEEPVAGARVHLRESARPAIGRAAFLARYARDPGEGAEGAATDEEGRFQLRNLPPGTYDLEARGSGFAPTLVRGLKISAGEPTDLGEIFLEGGVRVEGRVVDEDGRPVADVQISATPLKGLGAIPFGRPLAEGSQTTDGDGYFALEDLAAGLKLSLGFRKTGYLPHEASAVTAPTEEPLAIVLEEGSRVSGRVVDTRSEAIPGARVRLVEKRAGLAARGRILSRDLGEFWATTDGDGGFEIAGVKAGDFILVASARSFMKNELDGVQVLKGKDLQGLELALEEGASLEGRVRDTKGDPVSGVRISAEAPDASPTDFPFSSSHGVTDGEGRYRVDGLGTGLRVVSATHERYLKLRRDVDVKAGVNPLDLTLEAGQHISGRVVGPSGGAVIGASLRLQGSRGGWRGKSVTSDGSGRFRFEAVSAGRYVLQADHRDFATATLAEPVEVASHPIEDLELRMEPGGSIAGEVLGLEFDELARLQVLASRQDSMGRWPATGVVDYDGTYRIDHVTAGDWIVMATLDGGRTAVAPAKIPAGAGEIRVDLEFKGELTLSGQVLLGEEPLSGARIQAMSPGQMTQSGAVSDRRGRFELIGLEPGSYRLTVMSFEEGLSHFEDIELSSDRDLVVRIFTGSLRGRVFSASDQTPLEDAMIEVSRRDPSAFGRRGPGLGSITDSSGEFLFGRLPAGTWQVGISRSGYAQATRTVEISEGAAAPPLEIALEPTSGLTLEVRLSSGAPATTIWATLARGDTSSLQPRPYRAREGGRFHLPSVPAGSWDLLVSAPGEATVRTAVTVPGPPAQVQLPQSGALEIEVPDLVQALGYTVVTLVDAAGHDYRAMSSGHFQDRWPLLAGKAVLEDLPPGRWTVTATDQGGQTWTGEAAVAAGSRARLSLSRSAAPARP